MHYKEMSEQCLPLNNAHDVLGPAEDGSLDLLGGASCAESLSHGAALCIAQVIVENPSHGCIPLALLLLVKILVEMLLLELLGQCLQIRHREKVDVGSEPYTI